MNAKFRSDVDFQGIFRKLGHSLEEIRDRALENILSKLEHQLICDADLINEKHLYIRLLEWFNFPDCSKKSQVLGLLKRLAQHSSGAELLQDIGGVEFLSQLRRDVEACHRPVIDEVLESIMRLPDSKVVEHAPECIYHRPSESAVWGVSMSSVNEGSRSRMSQVSDMPNSRSVHTSIHRLGQHNHVGPGYFAASVSDSQTHGPNSERWPTIQPTELFMASEPRDNPGGLFRLSTFPWLPLTHTDQQVIASTNSSLQTRDLTMLLGACEFLSDVVFQDFPAELFLQRPEILKSLLSLVSLPAPADLPVVIQACHTLTSFTRCLQVRIRLFQDPVLYTSKQELNSATPSVASSYDSSSSQLRPPPSQPHSVLGWGGQRHRGDGQDGDSSTSASRASSLGLEPPDTGTEDELDHEDRPRLQSQQLSLPQFCVALLQRSLPRLHTAHEALGVAVVELAWEALTILTAVVDTELWGDPREAARDVVDRVTDCLDIACELLHHHHHSSHSVTPISADLGDLATHRLLYLGMASILTKFLLMIPLDQMQTILPEKLKSSLHMVAYDESLAMTHPRCRGVALAIAQTLGQSLLVDFQKSQDICRSLNKTCTFCLQWDRGVLGDEELVGVASEALQSMNYHLYLSFVSKFVSFISRVCSKKNTEKSLISQSSDILLKLLSFPVDCVRQAAYTGVMDVLKKSLHVSNSKDPNNKEFLKAKFVMNADILYEMSTFGLADQDAKIRSCSTECLQHLMQSQLLMAEGLWQTFMQAFARSLPVLQSYTDQSTALGRMLWSLLDPTVSTQNLSLQEKLRASLRLLYVSDRSLRIEAAKHIKWFLCNEQDHESKLPLATDLDPTKMNECLLVKSPYVMDEDPGRSVFTVEGMKQVLDIFTSDPVDPGVKKSAGEQLAIMMKDPHLHALFKEKGGVELVCSTLKMSVRISSDDSKEITPYVPACLSMLRSLAHWDYSLRHTLSRDGDVYYSLLRVSLLHHCEEQMKMDVSHILMLLLFDEVAKFDIVCGQADTPGTRFSLPAQVVKRYRLPLKPACHHVTSPSAVSLVEPTTDIMRTSGPKEMMRVCWNVSWHGGMEQLLDACHTGLFLDSASEFSSHLALTPIDRVVLQVSDVAWSMQAKVKAIREAASHMDVTAALDRMMSYSSGVKLPAVRDFLLTHDWYQPLEKFLLITPSSSSDQTLLLHVLRFISSALHCLPPSSSPAPTPALSWLIDKLYHPEGPLSRLISRNMGSVSERVEVGPQVKRNLDKVLLHYVITVNSHFPYQLCMRAKPGLMRGDMVHKLQRRLNISDAPHFYNLASLEGTLACLMHVTARPNWSKECSELDATSLCSQLLNSLLEVVWSFHIGRGGTSRSFMGKGVTKSTTLCLRHLAHEMINHSEDQDWVKNWLYTRGDNRPDTDQGLNWLLTLWAYRDAEVRVAGLGIAVALTSCEPGRLMVTANCKHVPGGIWGAAFSILLDEVECSMVCQQAALLLVNLTSQSMPSGHLETSPGTWQGPLVTDNDQQVVLIGLNALEALVDHTNLYAVVSDVLASLYTPSLIQPVLVTTEVPPIIMDLSANSTLSSTSNSSTAATGCSTDINSSMEKTGRTALTNVSSLSGQPTPKLTDRLKHPTSTEKARMSQDNVSSSANMESPRNSPAESLRDTSHARVSETQKPNLPERQKVSTPGLVTAVVKLMTNLVNMTPHSSLDNMRSRSILSSLLNLMRPSAIQSLCREMSDSHLGSSSALALRDLLLMYGSVADLLSACVLLDTNARMEVLANGDGLQSLLSLLLIDWRDKDDVGDACAVVSISVLRLLSSLLQMAGMAALTTLTRVLGHIWAPLVESMCTMLDDCTSSRVELYSACLDFVSRLCCEEAKNMLKNPERVVDTATISELLDASLLDGEDLDKSSPDTPTTGKMLCKVLVGLFDTVTSSSMEDKPATENSSGRLRIIGAIKSVLAVSQSAKQTALEAGLVESTMEHIKQTHARLNLETLGVVKSGGKKEEPFLQELIIMFDFLRNFMCNNPDIKVACHHSGLTTVIQRLWAWCLEEPALKSSALSLLVTYTAHCNSACSSLASPASAQVVGKAGGQGSLLHYVIRLSQRELDRDECSPTLRLTFALLINLAMCSECRNILWKNPFLNQFSQLNPRRRRGKMRVAMETLWMELLLALSFSVDGQQIILKVPDVLTVLMDVMAAGSSRCQHCATLIVRNMCCHAPNKPKLLAADDLVAGLVQQAENPGQTETQLVATSALVALVHNNHKARVHVKSANIAPRLAETLHHLQTSVPRSGVTGQSCENLKVIIKAVQD